MRTVACGLFPDRSGYMRFHPVPNHPDFDGLPRSDHFHAAPPQDEGNAQSNSAECKNYRGGDSWGLHVLSPIKRPRLKPHQRRASENGQSDGHEKQREADASS